MTVADLKERLKNTFLTLDYYGKEEVYGGKTFPAGTVALDVLNISEEIVERVLELTDPMMHFVDQLYLGKVDLLLMEKSRKNVFEVVDVLRKVPPFSYQDFTWLDEKLENIFSQKATNKASRKMHDPKGPGVIFVQALSLVAQLGFGTQGFREKLIPFIEDIGEADIRRDAAGFSEVFGKFFEKDDSEKDEWLAFSNASLQYLAGEKGLVRRLHYNSFPSMYRSNLFEALSVGNAPRKCPICGRFFLTTKAYPTLYCNTPCPGAERGMTCANVAAKMGGKFKQPPEGDEIQRIYEARRNTTRKYMREGKISWELGEMILKLAKSKRTKARIDNKYFQNSYEQEMEINAIMEEARRKLQ